MPKAKNATIERHDRIEKIPFHLYWTGALTAGVSSLAVNPDNLGRMTSIGDTFALYRATDMRLRLFPDAARTGTQILSWIPGVTDTAPSTVIFASYALSSVVLGATMTVPSAELRLNSNDLRSYTPWLKTKAGTPDVDVENQGTLYINGTGTDIFGIEIRGILEFKNPIAVGSTPAEKEMLIKRELLREKTRLLAILSTPDEKPKATKPESVKSGFTPHRFTSAQLLARSAANDGGE